MTKLGDICEYRSESITVEEAASLPLYISTDSMQPNRGSVSSSDLPTTGKVKRFEAGDTLVSNIRPYFKKIWHAKTCGACSNDILVFRPVDCSSDYLFWTINSDEFFAHVTKTAKGTKMPRGDKRAIMEYAVQAPSEDEQRILCQIMNSLQQKIVLNNQINGYLAELADSRFKRSFGCLEINACLSDIAEVIMGQSPAGSSYNEVGDGAVFYQGRGEFGWRYPAQRLFTTEPKRTASKGDVLMSVRAPVGDLNVAFENCCIGRGLAAIHSEFPSYTLYLMRSLKPSLDIYNSEGTVFGSVSGKTLKALPIALPAKTAILDYEDFARPIDGTIKRNEQESRALMQLRNALLPKLISGEIDVSKIDLTQLNSHLSGC